MIIAAVIGGAGLTACGASANPAAVVSSAATSAAATAQAVTPAATATALTPGPSPTPAASPTRTHTAAAEPSVTATHTESSPHATTSPSPKSSQTSTSSGTHNFTVPAIPGDNVVTAYGSYEKIGTARVKVTMCAKQTGSAFSVGAIALVYDASGADKNIGATILTGPGNSSCVNTTFILYTTHLKVHAFVGGSNGTIIKTGPVLTLY
ncbi:MAG: hypothetical protein ACRDPY_39980 [Streptosporangiaceae bacterium]